ncbi:unnamed protein product [Cercopithifilaria johnstoni]|uniref:L-Fucosyltransferase n=1 Tax=Cercopithifilaria johnstoni TaxID=2874296 RepID=A0A8J2M634_9BILA|nr:unnamed protein product [Cercopithifilaria johnstoni]
MKCDDGITKNLFIANEFIAIVRITFSTFIIGTAEDVNHTTKISTNGLQKKAEELKEKLGLLAGGKKEQQKITATKQKLKNLRKSKSPNKKTETSKQYEKSSVDKKISKGIKKGSIRQEKFCSVYQTTSGNAEKVIITRMKLKQRLWLCKERHRRSSICEDSATRNGLIFLTFAIISSFLLLIIINWSFYDMYVADSNRFDRLSIVQVTRIFPQGGEYVEFNQPWILPNTIIIENIEDISQSERYLISNFSWSPGLGNLMFQYASLRGIAERYKAKLIVPVKCKLRRGFKLDAIIVSNKLNDELIQRYSANEHHFMEDLIRKQFTFLPEIIERADEYLLKAKYKKYHAETAVIINLNHHNQMNITEDFYDYVYVGIHIRYGMDITMNSRNIKYGHKAITKDYIINAMNYFRSKFDKLIFVIISDNLHWVETNIKHIYKDEIYIVSSGYREVDMATLIRCNHTIMSTGTFSWWIAYLTNGTTVYYNDWPRHDSVLAKTMKKDEYFLNNWIPME